MIAHIKIVGIATCYLHKLIYISQAYAGSAMAV